MVNNFDIISTDKDKELFIELNNEVEIGNVRKFTHHKYPLVGFCYTPKCQFNKAWNNINMQARGLVFDLTDKYNPIRITNPMPKIFNLEELYNSTDNPIKEFVEKEEYIIKSNSFRIYSKLDGSLILTYLYNDKLHFMTKGSFENQQTRLAQSLWEKDYKIKYDAMTNDRAVKILTSDMYTSGHSTNPINGLYTFHFELIGPSNLNVCRTAYKKDELTLLNIRYVNWEEKDSKKIEISDFNFYTSFRLIFPIIKEEYFHNRNIEFYLKDIKYSKDNKIEGIIFKNIFNNNKIKLKSDLYKELHRVLTGEFTIKRKMDIWYNQQNNEVNSSLENIPDEFFSEIKEQLIMIENEFNIYLKEKLILFEEMQKKVELNNQKGISYRDNRKLLALEYKKDQYLLDLLFLENENTEQSINKRVREHFYKRKIN